MTPEIVVLAGVNGAGKSSIAGAALEQSGATYYNPDRATQDYVQAGLSLDQANARAWERGRAQLERCIAEGASYAFETTLGGRTITRLLLEAAGAGHRVRMWYVALASPELHVERVRERVARGGHDIPESKIRERWKTSRENLIRLLPYLAELDLYDNSEPASPAAGIPPRPLRVLHARDGVIDHIAAPRRVPGSLKSVVEAALRTWRVS